MSLATRCTACGTVFRVVQDQLKVSEGWVRCGRCAEVFDAREQLFDLELEAPPPWPGPAEAPEDTQDSNGFEQTRVDSTHGDALRFSEQPSDQGDWQIRSSEDDRLSSSASDEFDADGQMPDESSDSSQWLRSPDTPDEYSSDHAPDYLAGSDRQAPASIASELDGLAANPDDSPLAPPSFVRNATKVRPALSPMQNGLWAGFGVALALSLAWQALFHYRDTLAAANPQAEILLKQMCQLLSCEIPPLQRIDALSVESSSLTRAPGNAKRYQLAVTLRNRSDSALALPWFDLSLSDSGGTLLARRVLSPADFAASGPATGKPAGTIAAKSQLSLLTILQAGDTGLVGYTVEVFYP